MYSTAWYNQNWHVPLSRGKRLINRRNMVKCFAGRGYYCHSETTMKGEKGREGDTPQLPLPSHSSVCTFSCIQKIKFRVGGQGKNVDEHRHIC